MLEECVRKNSGSFNVECERIKLMAKEVVQHMEDENVEDFFHIESVRERFVIVFLVSFPLLFFLFVL